MMIPGPDRYLLRAADALAMAAQRRGVPLPRILAAAERGVHAGHGALGLALLASGLFGAALMYAGLAALMEGESPGRLSRLSADARSWSPRLALRYGAEAASAREVESPWRTVSLCLALATPPALAGLSDAHPAALAVGGTFLLLALARLGRDYARCVPPVDPGSGTRRRPSVSVPA